MYLRPKYPYEANNQFLINKRESAGSKYHNDPIVFIEYSSYTDDISEHIEECNQSKIRKMFLIFDDMICDMLSNSKFEQITILLFIRGRKLNIFFVLLHNLLLLYWKILD